MATVTASVAGAARRAPAFAPDRDRDRRPDLRVAESAARRRRVGVWVGAAVTILLFLIVGSFRLIYTEQAHIDSVNRHIAAAKDTALQLRLQLAELQSPQYVTTAATTRLNMIPAPTPVYLQPRATDDAHAAEIPATPAPAPVPAPARTTATAVKPAATATTPTTAAPTTGTKR